MPSTSPGFSVQRTERDVNPSARLAIDEADHFLHDFQNSYLHKMGIALALHQEQKILDFLSLQYPPHLIIEDGLATFTNGLEPHVD